MKSLKLTLYHLWSKSVYVIIGLLLIIPFIELDAREKPNIVYILTDDLGYGDLGCYGQQTLETPHIDTLAKGGIRFMNHYSGSTVCAPSRCVLMTGLHTGHARVRGNNAVLMKDSDLTIAKLLKQNGYKTGCFGKWGIGHPPPYDDPQRKGFDDFFGYINMWHAHNFWPEFLIENGKKVKLRNQVLEKYDEPKDKEGRGVATVKKDYAPHLITEKALSFIDQNKKQPFFLFFALNMPHANNEAGGDPVAQFDGMEVPDHGSYINQKWPNQEKGFAQMITLIDDYVGQIQARLKEHHLHEKTLIIFSSDNGPHQEGRHKMEFFDSNGQLRGMKRDLYEGGLRVPMIAYWPKTIAAGTVTQHVSAFQDVLPTIADILDVSVDRTDGISFLPTLLGNYSLQKTHPHLYWEFYEKGGRQSVLLGHMKGVRYNMLNNPKAPVQLFNVRSDVREEHDIAMHHPELVQEMLRIMEESHVDPSP